MSNCYILVIMSNSIVSECLFYALKNVNTVISYKSAFTEEILRYDAQS